MSRSRTPRPPRRPTASQPALKLTSARAAVPLASSTVSTDFLQAFQADAMERVRIVKRGVPAGVIDTMARRMGMPKEKLIVTLGLARATVDRKARDSKPLSPDEGSKVLGMARLVGQVQAMVEESGDAAGFDAAAWVAGWLDRPLPALGGQRPAELMDTAEGQGLVSQLVARMRSGAYA
ncbi:MULTISPECIES: antitoxin Xre/MbcA/ParS toxin-binding domain-containing protein [unclassified Rhizobacter]|uniref:antitoxin Xre/MbcA/ParS toxin-binding domain-containing protein n=1 Tax=unclassified Rhizobacter TaxID=2640088 RepID=UPI000AC7A527|nr:MULTISPECIES: antitoxin Xre/MbcA/ParS toxin-binding domain-containing protein [unclassified Rhizobacter]